MDKEQRKLLEEFLYGFELRNKRYSYRCKTNHHRACTGEIRMSRSEWLECACPCHAAGRNGPVTTNVNETRVHKSALESVP